MIDQDSGEEGHLVPLKVFDDLLAGDDGEDDEEGEDGHPSPCWGDIGDLLQQPNSQEEDVSIPASGFGQVEEDDKNRGLTF